MAETTSMNVQLPATIVEDIVRAEIMRHLGATADIVANLVQAAAKDACTCDKHRYNAPKKTRIGCEMECQIEKTLKTIVSNWITENRADFEKALLIEMSKPGRLKALVGAFAAGIRTGEWAVNVALNLKDGSP